MKIGFIGAGNMAQAMISGLLSAKPAYVAAEDILVHSAQKKHYEPYAQKLGLDAQASNLDVAQGADLIILAVAPKLYQPIIEEIKPTLEPAKVLASVLTGVSIADLMAAVGDPDVPVVRLMPNVNVKINQGMTALAGNAASHLHGFGMTEHVFETLGSITEIAEDQFSIFAALAGCSPAFTYLFIDSLSRAGVKYGLTKAQATQIAAQAVKGSAQMALEDGRSPFDLADQVCSPGGTTVAGLLAMEEHGLMTSVVKGIDAVIQKEQG